MWRRGRYRGIFPKITSYEPNDDRRVNPWGPMQAGVVYRAKLCRGDEEDHYFFDVGGTDLEHGSRLDVVRVRFASP